MKSPRATLHETWRRMHRRCSDKASSTEKTNYHDRGIRVCVGWQDFDAFVRSMGPKPDGFSIDRIDNDRGYDCGVCSDCIGREAAPNCRWASASQQQRNKRANRMLRLAGERRCLTEWAELYGVTAETIKSRLRNGWSDDIAITCPVDDRARSSGLRGGRTSQPKLSHEGMSLTVTDWARRLGISAETIKTRLRRGWPLSRALSSRNHKNRVAS